jgi:hypothetical protein
VLNYGLEIIDMGRIWIGDVHAVHGVVDKVVFWAGKANAENYGKHCENEFQNGTDGNSGGEINQQRLGRIHDRERKTYFILDVFELRVMEGITSHVNISCHMSERPAGLQWTGKNNGQFIRLEI